MIHEHNQKFVNMTPHVIRMVDNDHNLILKIEPSGDTIRLDEEWGPLGEFTFAQNTSEMNTVDCTIPIEHCQMSATAELPPITDNVWYIVSRAVCESYPNRTDFVMVGKTVRDDKGRICGAKCFSQLN